MGIRASVVLIAVLMASCGRRSEIAPAGRAVEDGSEVVVVLGPAPALTCKPKPRYRWRDALGHPYGARFRQTFSYAKAHVELRYARRAPVFRGRLVARGLKPNFAYQIKLGGKPTAIFGEDGDDWANEQLGLAGRWWAEQFDAASDNLIRAWRSNDAEYHEWRSRNFADETSRVVFTGYLLFDFILTNARGSAERVSRILLGRDKDT